MGQLLAGTAYLASRLQKDLAAKSLPEARQSGRILELINEGIAQTRNLARGLHPVEAGKNGLMAALKLLAARTKKLFQVRCRFTCRRPVLIQDNAVATHLFRIAQEAVTNAIKHGKPGRIVISLTEYAGAGHIWRSRTMAAACRTGCRKKPGMGLRIMRYRAGMIGGSLAIQKGADGGTAVVCTVHLSDEGTMNLRSPPTRWDKKILIWQNARPIPSPAAARKKILIVDDHPMMREGLRAVINREPDLMVCGEAENANQALEAVQKLAPDLALVDITLPGGKSGLELVKDLKAMRPRPKNPGAFPCTTNRIYAERMLRAGAGGYITKHQPSEELIKAIRQGVGQPRLCEQGSVGECPAPVVRAAAGEPVADGNSHRPRI